MLKPTEGPDEPQSYSDLLSIFSRDISGEFVRRGLFIRELSELGIHISFTWKDKTATSMALRLDEPVMIDYFKSLRTEEESRQDTPVEELIICSNPPRCTLFLGEDQHEIPLNQEVAAEILEQIKVELLSRLTPSKVTNHRLAAVRDGYRSRVTLELVYNADDVREE